MQARLAAVLLVAFVAVLVGAGPGGEASKTPAQVLTDMKQATQTAKSVHFAGTINAPGSKVVLDLTIERGVGGAGRIVENGLVIDVVRIGEKVYVHGSDAFYRKFAGKTGVQLFHGRWLEFPTTEKNMASFTDFTDIDKLFGGVISTHGKLKNEGATTYDGQKAVALRDVTKGGTLYVAASGSPYPIAIAAQKTAEGLITFDHWNSAVTITAPKNAIDMAKLTKKAGG
jgi:hypothetical protein